MPPRPTAPAPTAPPPQASDVSDGFFSFLGKKKLTPEQKQAKKDQEAARETTKKAQKEERARIEKAATAEGSGRYTDRLDRMKSALGDLEARKPATQKLIAAMKKAMTAADTILAADPQAYAKAYKALHSGDFSLHKIDEQAAAATSAADKAGRKAYPDAYRVADEITRHLKGSAVLTQSRLDAIEGEPICPCRLSRKGVRDRQRRGGHQGQAVDAADDAARRAGRRAGSIARAWRSSSARLRRCSTRRACWSPRAKWRRCRPS
ncbi:hypothetical protein AB5I41_09175 [Sphingomonas sp. MMS24-JH45]